MSNWLEIEKKTFEARGFSFPEHSDEEIEEMAESFEHGKKVNRIFRTYYGEIDECLKNRGKPIGTNLILYVQAIRKKRFNKRRQFNESFSGVKIETKKDFQVDWLEYLDLDNGLK
jgi:hypothetical protein